MFNRIIGVFLFAIFFPLFTHAELSCPRGYYEMREPFSGNAICTCGLAEKLGTPVAGVSKFGTCTRSPFDPAYTFTFDNRDITSNAKRPVLWLDASDPDANGVYPTVGRVFVNGNQWRDKSGNNNHATKAGTNNITLIHDNDQTATRGYDAFTRPVLSFDGTSYFTLAAHPLPSGSPAAAYTMFAVIKPTINKARMNILSIRGSNTISAPQIQWRIDSNTTLAPSRGKLLLNFIDPYVAPYNTPIPQTKHVYQDNLDSTNPTAIDQNVLTSGNYYVVSLRYDPPCAPTVANTCVDDNTTTVGGANECRFNMYVNGARLVPATVQTSPLIQVPLRTTCNNNQAGTPGAAAPLLLNSTGPTSMIGAGNNPGDQNPPYTPHNYLGSMAEIMIYDTALTQAEVLYIQRKLMIKWGTDYKGFTYAIPTTPN